MNQLNLATQIILVVLVSVLLLGAAVWALLRRRRAFRARIAARFGQIPEATEAATLQFLAESWRFRQSHDEIPFFIDDTTWNDLDMDKVFSRVNACRTSTGEECLYARLHTPAMDEAPLRDWQTLLNTLEAQPDKRLALQVLLTKMGKSPAAGLLPFGCGAKSKRLKYPAVYTLLALMPLLCAGLFFVNASLGLFAVLAAFIVNIVVYSLKKLSIERELAALRSFSSLLWCAKKICRLGLSPEITASLEPRLRVFRRISGKMASLTREKLSDADMLADYVKIPLLTDIRNFNRALRLIGEHAADFRSLYDTVGALDAAAAVLSFRTSLPHWCRPQFTEARAVEAQEVYHPLLTSPVANDISLTRSSLVSGSNASGKSTFIKALAVNGIFAQTIGICAARAYRTRFVLVVTSMAVRDDIEAGESYFITELKSLRRVLDSVRHTDCVCYIDEILKGTNTIERIAASAAVLGWLCAQPSLCMAATHDIELTRLLAGSMDNYHFAEQMTDAGMAFDYRLREGPSRTRNAIRLLGHMEFDASVLEEAERLVKRFEQTGSWEAR